MESYGIPTGDLDSLITEEFDSSNSRRNNQENINVSRNYLLYLL